MPVERVKLFYWSDSTIAIEDVINRTVVAHLMIKDCLASSTNEYLRLDLIEKVLVAANRDLCTLLDTSVPIDAHGRPSLYTTRCAGSRFHVLVSQVGFANDAYLGLLEQMPQWPLGQHPKHQRPDQYALRAMAELFKPRLAHWGTAVFKKEAERIGQDPTQTGGGPVGQDGKVEALRKELQVQRRELVLMREEIEAGLESLAEIVFAQAESSEGTAPIAVRDRPIPKAPQPTLCLSEDDWVGLDASGDEAGELKKEGEGALAGAQGSGPQTSTLAGTATVVADTPVPTEADEADKQSVMATSGSDIMPLTSNVQLAQLAELMAGQRRSLQVASEQQARMAILRLREMAGNPVFDFDGAVDGVPVAAGPGHEGMERLGKGREGGPCTWLHN